MSTSMVIPSILAPAVIIFRINGICQAVAFGLTYIRLQIMPQSVWQHLTTVLASLYTNSHDMNWMEGHKVFTSSHRLLELPAYAWDLKEYYIPYEGDWCLHQHRIECACADPNGPVNHTGRSIGLCPTHKTPQAAISNKVEAPKVKAAPETASKPVCCRLFN